MNTELVQFVCPFCAGRCDAKVDAGRLEIVHAKPGCDVFSGLSQFEFLRWVNRVAMMAAWRPAARA